jgi:eukaryotic-like serine/threonine-protein kinase
MPKLRLALTEALGPLYRVEREVRPVGDNRMFVAHMLPDGAELIVKVLPPALSTAVDVGPFERQVLLLAERLRHPHLAAPLGAGRAGAFVYHTRPFIAGTTLRYWLVNNGAMALTRAVEVLRALLSGLAHAHAADIAHGDLTLDEVLLGDSGILVADTGIAGALGRSLTAGSEVEPTPQGDMAAVRALALEMLTGRPAIEAEQVLERDRTPPRWLAEWLGTRWQDAPEALAAFGPPLPPRSSGPQVAQPLA